MTHPINPAETTRGLLDRFARHRVLILGDLILDEYLSGQCSRISPEAPVPVVAVSETRAVLGGAANTAHNVKALGGEAVLIGLTGNDDAGARLAAKAADAGIDLRRVSDGRPTVRKVRVLGQHQQLLRLDYEDPAEIDSTAEAKILDAVLAALPHCSIVVISDYAKGVLTARLCQAVVRAVHADHKRVIIDPRPQHAAFYNGCDYLTPNWKEALGLLGQPDVAPNGEHIKTVGRAVARAFGAHVVLTLGAKGMQFFSRSGQSLFEEPSLAKEVFDVSGAGDTVVAALAMALAAGAEHRDAVALANRAAGLVVGKLGTATVSPKEMLGETEAERAPLSRPELQRLGQSLRANGKRLVTINGAFDVLHSGHLHILHEARRQGDVLFVGVNSDASVRGYKGAGRPLVGEQERSRLLLGLRDVDYVHLFDEPEPTRFLNDVRPHVHVNGAEYGADCIEAPAVRALGARLHIVDRLPGLSTSDLVARMAGGTASPSYSNGRPDADQHPRPAQRAIVS